MRARPRRLGLDVDAAVVDGLVDRVAALLGESPDGWLDDSHDGRGQVDMYTVDAYLFAEPFADRLGAVWERGIASAARLVEAVVTPGGAALPWGRSIGALAVCHSGELAAVLLRRAHEGGAPVDAERWWGWRGRRRPAPHPGSTAAWWWPTSGGRRSATAARSAACR